MSGGFRMSVEGIHEAVRDKRSYHPVPLDESEMDITKGTKIVLRDIKRQRLGRSVLALRRRLARRFFRNRANP